MTDLGSGPGDGFGIWTRSMICFGLLFHFPMCLFRMYPEMVRKSYLEVQNNWN